MANFGEPKFQKYKMLLKMHLPEGEFKRANSVFDFRVSTSTVDLCRCIIHVVLCVMYAAHKYTGAVRQKMTADGFGELADGFLEFINDPGAQAAFQAQCGSSDDGKINGGMGAAAFKIKDDPKFFKYFKMLKMHLPRGAVDQKMRADGVDSCILDEDPESISPNSPPGSVLDGGGDGGSSGSHGDSINRNTVKPNMGKGSVVIQRGTLNEENVAGFQVGRDQFVLAMCMASGFLNIGINNAAAVGMTPTKDVVCIGSRQGANSGHDSAVEGAGGAGLLRLIDDPAYTKYFKMLKMHLPRGAVAQKMVADGRDPQILDMDPNGPSPNQPDAENDGIGGNFSRGVRERRDNQKMQKYFRMQKLHLPVGAIRQKMVTDGVPEELQELFFEAN